MDGFDEFKSSMADKGGDLKMRWQQFVENNKWDKEKLKGISLFEKTLLIQTLWVNGLLKNKLKSKTIP